MLEVCTTRGVLLERLGASWICGCAHRCMWSQKGRLELRSDIPGPCDTMLRGRPPSVPRSPACRRLKTYAPYLMYTRISGQSALSSIRFKPEHVPRSANEHKARIRMLHGHKCANFYFALIVFSDCADPLALSTYKEGTDTEKAPVFIMLDPHFFAMHDCSLPRTCRLLTKA